MAIEQKSINKIVHREIIDKSVLVKEQQEQIGKDLERQKKPSKSENWMTEAVKNNPKRNIIYLLYNK